MLVCSRVTSSKQTELDEELDQKKKDRVLNNILDPLPKKKMNAGKGVIVNYICKIGKSLYTLRNRKITFFKKKKKQYLIISIRI